MKQDPLRAKEWSVLKRSCVAPPPAISPRWFFATYLISPIAPIRPISPTTAQTL